MCRGHSEFSLLISRNTQWTIFNYSYLTVRCRTLELTLFIILKFIFIDQHLPIPFLCVLPHFWLHYFTVYIRSAFLVSMFEWEHVIFFPLSVPGSFQWTMFSRIAHVDSSDMAHGWIVFHCVYIPHFLYSSSIDGHPHGLHIMAVVNSATVDIGKPICVWCTDFLFGCICRVGRLLWVLLLYCIVWLVLLKWLTSVYPLCNDASSNHLHCTYSVSNIVVCTYVCLFIEVQ